jgi:multicomponent Na+:H+ antiporter subunit F
MPEVAMLMSVGLVAVMVTMLLAFSRAVLGPTIFDRILALNNFGTCTVLFIALYGFASERPDFLDLALVYALMNFIGTIAVLKYLEGHDLGATDDGGGR